MTRRTGLVAIWLAVFLVFRAAAAAPDRMLVTAASTPAADGGTWRTEVLFYNPSTAITRLGLVFHPTGQAATESDPSLALSLRPGEVRAFDDLLSEGFRTSGSGSLDILVIEGSAPLVNARVHHDTTAGTYGLSVPVPKPSDALSAGDRIALLVPGSGQRFNVGARTIGGPVTLECTIQDGNGVARASTKKVLLPSSHLQQPAADFLGTASVRPGDVVLCDVRGGSVFLYGTPIDERTGDGSYVAAERVGAAPSTDPPLTNDFTPPTGKGTPPPGGGPVGPWSLRTVTATSTDGLNFKATGKLVTDQAGVSDIVVNAKGWIYVYYVGWTVGSEQNKLVVAISTDGGSKWVYKRVVVSGSDGLSDPVDPDVQILDDGTFRLLATSAPRGEPVRSYRSESSDGIHFTLKGVAFYPNAPVYDPSTVKIGSTWHLVAGRADANAFWHATSADGTSYTADELLANERSLMNNGIPVPGGVRFYLLGGQGASVTSAFTADGTAFRVDHGTLVDTTGATVSGLDPGVIRLENGSYFMTYEVLIP